MIRDSINDLLQQAISKSGIDDTNIALAHPANPEHGDFSTSIALKHAKSRGVNPMELAHQIADQIDQNGLVEKVEVLKPGFINLTLKTDILLDELKNEAIDSKSSNKTIIIEYGQPNTHKLPHIGHLFSYVFGESLSRILEKNGNKLIRTNYQGDIGPHVAKCLWHVTHNKSEYEDVKDRDLKDKINYLQVAYQLGSQAYESDVTIKEEIDRINKRLYQGDDRELNELWKETRKWCINYYQEFEKNIGISYDRSYFESETWKKGKDIVTQNVGKIFEESQGAIIFPGEKYGLHTRVFISSQGNPTYEGKDVGLIFLKRTEYKFDESIVTTAVEQNGYWSVVKKAEELLIPELTGKQKHLGFGMINLTTGKMSSRTGKIVSAFQLVQLTKEAVSSTFSLDDSALIDSIALSAIKYSFLKSDPFKNMNFDLEKSIAREGDSGPYLLYTYVRTQSILRQADIKSDISLNDVVGEQVNDEEKGILRLLYQFPEVIETAAKQYAPSLIATYLFSLAQSYNLFYQKHQVLKAEGAQKDLRLSLTLAVGKTLKSGLHLLGIETVEKM